MHPPNPNARASQTLWLRELRATAALGWPIILTNLTQMGMGTTDVVMMGWLGPETVAAGALGINLYLVALIFGIGLLNAVAPMIAHALGAQAGGCGPATDDVSTDVRRSVQQGFWLAACVAVPAWCILWWSGPLLVAMGQDRALAMAAGTYVRALQWGMLPFLCYIVLRAFVSALERPGWSLAIGVAALAVNALGNWCLMLGRCGIAPLGIAGSGLATLISSCLMFAALAVVVSFEPQFSRYRLLAHWWRPDWSRLQSLLRLGLPLAATLAFEVTIFNAAVFLMGLLGPAELAAHAVVIQLAALSFMVPLGIGQAATVRVGLAFGAGDADGIARAGWSALAIALACAAIASLTMILIPAHLIALFFDMADPANARVITLATTFLAVGALFQVVDAAQAVGSGMLRGLKDARVPMLYALLGYWGIGLPLGAALAFPFRLGGVGIWLGLAAGLTIVATLMIRRCQRREGLGLLRPADAQTAVNPPVATLPS